MECASKLKAAPTPSNTTPCWRQSRERKTWSGSPASAASRALFHASVMRIFLRRSTCCPFRGGEDDGLGEGRGRAWCSGSGGSLAGSGPGDSEPSLQTAATSWFSSASVVFGPLQSTSMAARPAAAAGLLPAPVADSGLSGGAALSGGARAALTPFQVPCMVAGV